MTYILLLTNTNPGQTDEGLNIAQRNHSLSTTMRAQENFKKAELPWLGRSVG